MNLHIVKDEKFIDAAYEVFESVAPGRNHFVVIGLSAQLKHITGFQPEIIAFTDALNDEYLKKIERFDVIFIHYMTDYAKEIVKRINKDIKIVWVGWGNDYYQLIYISHLDNYSKITKKFWQNTFQNRLGAKVKNGFKSLLVKIEESFCSIFFVHKLSWRRFLAPIKYRNDKDLFIYNKINYFSPVLHEDYLLVKEATPDFKPKYISWNYGVNYEQFVENNFDEKEQLGPNILVGNSATWTNNHLDIFDSLKEVERPEGKIICPLSYGNNEYGQMIADKGHQIFGNDFIPLIEFMPKIEYFELLKTCSILIMGHLRQQGLGNVIYMMYLGASVLLHRDSPIYKFFQSKGAVIYTLEELSKIVTDHPHGIGDKSTRINRHIIKESFGREEIKRRTVQLLKTINSS